MREPFKPRSDAASYRKPRTHYLKCLPDSFRTSKLGVKPFELRRNDRNFQVDDVLVLQEYDPTEKRYTGEHLFWAVTYVLNGPSPHGLAADHCILGLRVSNLGPLAVGCTCDMSSGTRGMDRCGRCDGTGSRLLVRSHHQIFYFPNTMEGYVDALLKLGRETDM
jgi:hypothetical protein